MKTQTASSTQTGHGLSLGRLVKVLSSTKAIVTLGVSAYIAILADLELAAALMGVAMLVGIDKSR